MKITVYSKERGVRTLKEGITLAQYQEKYPSAIQVKPPTVKTMERWMDDGVAKAVDGCRVEPDGECSHGYPSWLVAYGLI